MYVLMCNTLTAIVFVYHIESFSEEEHTIVCTLTKYDLKKKQGTVIYSTPHHTHAHRAWYNTWLPIL